MKAFLSPPMETVLFCGEKCKKWGFSPFEHIVAAFPVRGKRTSN